jgi:hypothetical protein
MKRWVHFICWLAIALIMPISFREFSPAMATSLNADKAIHILMAYDFQVPEDLYYWGQDRLGSLIPMLAHGLIWGLGLAPVVAVSSVQYGVLALGVACLSTVLTLPVHRLILVMAWLLPAWSFRSIVANAQPYGPQFAMIGVAIATAHRLFQTPLPPGHWQRHSLLLLLAMASFASLWLSELSIVPVGLLVILLILHYGEQVGAASHRNRPLAWSKFAGEWSNLALGTVLGITFIAWGKANALRPSRRLMQVLSWTEISSAIQQVVASLWMSLTFQGDSGFLSLGAWFVVLLVTYTSIISILRLYKNSQLSKPLIAIPTGDSQPGAAYRRWGRQLPVAAWEGLRQQLWYRNPQTKWLWLFGSSAVISLGLLVSSRWVYQHNMNLRYFALTYICTWMFALLLAEQAHWRSRWMSGWLLAIALCFSLSLPMSVYALQPRPSYVERLAVLNDLGPAGFIGDYSHFSYNLCVVNPAIHKCTSRQRGGWQPGIPRGEWVGVRCTRCIEDVLQSPVIYLVKRNWLDEFPAKIQQFDHTLIQIGEPIKILGEELAPYRVAGAE